MRFRGTLILLAVLAALSAYVLLVERKAPAAGLDAGTPVPTPEPPLLAFASADAREVRIEDLAAGRLTSLVYRESGLWHITAPVEEEADQGKVVRLVEELADLRPRRALTETTAPLSDYHLDPPAMRVAVVLQDGSTHAVLLGSRNPDGTAYYALVEGGSTVYLVPTLLGTDAERYLETPPVRPTPTPTAVATPTVAATTTPQP